MRIKTESAWWQFCLAIGSALIGVLFASLFGWVGQPDREITVYSNVARSHLTGPGIWPESKTKQISIHEYVIKNTGNVAFDHIQMRLSPQGGDGAQDSQFIQDLQFAGVFSSEAIPSDIKISRDHNAVIVDLKEIQPSEEFNFTIMNDNTSDSYKSSILPANISLKENEQMDWRPVDFPDLSIGLRIFIVIMFILVGINGLAMLYDLFKFFRKKVVEDG